MHLPGYNGLKFAISDKPNPNWKTSVEFVLTTALYGHGEDQLSKTIQL